MCDPEGEHHPSSHSRVRIHEKLSLQSGSDDRSLRLMEDAGQASPASTTQILEGDNATTSPPVDVPRACAGHTTAGSGSSNTSAQLSASALERYQVQLMQLEQWDQDRRAAARHGSPAPPIPATTPIPSQDWHWNFDDPYGVEPLESHTFFSAPCTATPDTQRIPSRQASPASLRSFASCSAEVSAESKETATGHGGTLREQLSVPRDLSPDSHDGPELLHTITSSMGRQSIPRKRPFADILEPHGSSVDLPDAAESKVSAPFSFTSACSSLKADGEIGLMSPMGGDEDHVLLTPASSSGLFGLVPGFAAEAIADPHQHFARQKQIPSGARTERSVRMIRKRKASDSSRVEHAVTRDWVHATGHELAAMQKDAGSLQAKRNDPAQVLVDEQLSDQNPEEYFEGQQQVLLPAVQQARTWLGAIETLLMTESTGSGGDVSGTSRALAQLATDLDRMEAGIMDEEPDR